MGRAHLDSWWRYLALGGLLCALLAAVLTGLAPDERDVAKASPGESCAAQGLEPVGDTGFCTHGPDPASPVNGAGGVAAAGEAPPIACDGDGASGNRVEVLYARASDVSSRHAAVLPQIRAAAEVTNAIYAESAAATGGSRAIRFVHSAPVDGSCEVAVAEVVLPPEGDDDLEWTVFALQALGYDRTDRVYLVFVDANVYCGIATTEQDRHRDGRNRNNTGPGYARVDAGCWDGTPPAHELGHVLGAVQLNAPHASGGGHCTDEYDLMCYSDPPNFPPMRSVCVPADTYDELLDCNHDDYFHTDPPPGSYLDTYWNVANSRFLIGAADRPPLPPPANDDVADAIRTGGRPFVDTQVVLSATSPEDDPGASCRQGRNQKRDNSVWYVTRPASDGTVTVDTAGSNYDTNLSVYAATAGGLDEVACAGRASPDDRQARTAFQVAAGGTYYVLVTSTNPEPDLLNIRIEGPAEMAPAVMLSKDKSKYNGPVVASLSGFAPDSLVDLRWPRPFSNDPGAAPAGDLLASGRTDAAGRATLAFRTPLEPYGDYAVTARDGAGGAASATLRVIPRVLLNERAGTSDTRLRAYFYGFAPGERIEVRWHDGATAETPYRVLATLTVADNGRAATRAFTAPDGEVGNHLVVGKVIGVARSASASFALRAGAASLSEPSPTASASPTPTVAATATTAPEPTVEPTLEPTPEPTMTAPSDATPVADAGDDVAAVHADGSGLEPVQLDGSGSFDPESDSLEYTWTVAGAEVATE